VLLGSAKIFGCCFLLSVFLSVFGFLVAFEFFIYFIKVSSKKHHFQDSPGSYDFIKGCLVLLKCFDPCLFLEESQHPTCPHVKHKRK
jgi:hypothetical protein